MSWKPIETAPLWVEVIVRYDGNRCLKSQPNNVCTAVQTDIGKWDLGSLPDGRTPISWMDLPNWEGDFND